MPHDTTQHPERAPGDSDDDGEAVHRLELLLEAAAAIAAERTLEAVLARVVESARTVVGARYAALGVVSEDGKRLVDFVTSGLTEAERMRIGALPTGRGILGLLIREGRALRITDLQQHPQSAGFPDNHPPMHSFLGVPIAIAGRIYGNLYLTEKIGAKEFTRDDERVAVLLGSRAAAAIENARLNDAQAEVVSELRTLQRQRDQFFAMINHELRNALTGVYGWAEQLTRAKSDAAKDRAIGEVYDAAERTITLVNNLLDLSRLDAGKVQPAFKATALQQVVRRAWATVEPAAQAKGITFHDHYADVPAIITSDPVKVEQIVVNLLSNAVRHSPRGEAIALSAEVTLDELVVSVTDRGQGIPQADQQRIFEPFIRVDPESGLGSGLGLSVSRRMAELLGGRIAVHSDLGRGATFTLTLPLGPPP